MSLDPIIHSILTLSFSMLFALSAWSKWTHHGQFTEVLRAYDLVPQILIKPTSFALPFMESIVAVGLLVSAFQAPAILIGIVLILTYACAMATNLIRGRKDLDCGCHLGTAERTSRISNTLVYRNLALCGVALLVLAPITPRELALVDMALIGFAVLVLGTCYATFNQLVTNHTRFKQMYWFKEMSSSKEMSWSKEIH